MLILESIVRGKVKEKIMAWIKDRLKEKSSWAAIAGVIGTVTGYIISPEYIDIIASVAILILSGTAFGTKAKKK